VRKIALVLSGLVALAGAACSSQAAAKTAAPKKPALAHSVTITEGDMFVRGSATKVAAGNVTFTVTNSGAIDHEFVIVSGDPTGTSGDEVGRVSEADHVGGEEGPEIGEIAPGKTKTMSATLTPGTYTAMCNLPGHFGGGMHFEFVVE